IASGWGDPGEMARLRQFQALQYRYLGNPKKSLEVFLTMAREVDRPGVKGWLFNAYRFIGWNLLKLGKLDQADAYVHKAQALLGEARSWPGFALYGNSWQGEVEETTAYWHEATGRFSEAEAAYRRAEVFKRLWLIDSSKLRDKTTAPPAQIQLNIDTLITGEG